MPITDDQVEAALDYLKNSAGKAAKARAERAYVEEYRKVVKAQIMRENHAESLGAQEAIAYNDPRYKQHLEAMREAIERDEYMRWMQTAAETKIQAYQTQSANTRKGMM